SDPRRQGPAKAGILICGRETPFWNPRTSIGHRHFGRVSVGPGALIHPLDRFFSAGGVLRIAAFKQARETEAREAETDIFLGLLLCSPRAPLEARVQPRYNLLLPVCSIHTCIEVIPLPPVALGER